ncbi:MAG TPA: hypothetical protein VN901_05010 [Candidatus Acidoferrales bacterium]|nr:hypothetical protein [Candidatus Acidoferrales bacterium]
MVFYRGWKERIAGSSAACRPGGLSSDYFSIPEDDVKSLESVLTIVGGKIVYAAGEYSNMAPPELPVSPDWSPVKQYGGYASSTAPVDPQRRRVRSNVTS